MNSMTYIGKVFSNVRDFYYEINGATLTGAIDVVVVEQPDGTFTCSPFHVRFGKLGVLRSREKIVDIEINGEPQDIHMKLGESGEAFFVEEVQSTDCENIPAHLATSPIPVSEFEELFTAATKSDKPRRNSVDLGCNTAVVASIAAVISEKQQVSDYTQRRYTGGTEREYAMQKRDFVARQVELGNLSTESMNTSLCMDLNVSDSTFDNVDHHDQEGVFQMEELEPEGPKVFIAETVEDPQTLINDFIPIKTDESVNKLSENIEKSEADSKNGKKRRRKKSIMKKKNAQRKQSVGNNEQNFINDKDSTSEKMSDISDESKTDLSTEKSQGGSEETEDTIIDNEPQTNARNINRDPDFHFFSDTELTANSINTSRPGSPIQSDSEFEFSQRKPEPEIDGQSWAWGQLPTTAAHIEITAADKEVQKTTERNSMLSGMFSFMKQSNRLRHAKDSEGLYLTELSSGTIDPEVAALYFPRKTKATTEVDDCESGNGPSLPQSPNSMEGAKSVDSDFEEAVKDIHKYLQDISISLCGWMEPPSSENFLRHLIPFSNLCNNPAILDSPDLVVRLNGKYYSWKTAVPLVMSLIIYQRPLPQSTVDQLCTMHMPENTLQDKISKEESKSYSWWRWRSSKRPSTDASTTQQSELVVSEKPKQEAEDVIDGPEVIRTTENTVITIESDTIGSKIDGKEQQNEDAGGYSGSQSSEDSDHAARDISETKVQKQVSRIMGDEKYRKTLRLSSEQIANLHLNDGMNEVEFSVTTAYQGTTRCKCHIYKWRFDDKIVISDIDGTITKSDVLGHILPIVGKDWAQSGVAQLFTKIKNNGYKLLYLSARAIGQARVTREYLRSIKQGDLSLPDGPLLLNPTSLISAFHREVIERKPEQFKIQCLSDIQALFPPDSNPFYAGYGNRINDVWAYRAVGIPIVRIFTINHKGELKHELTQTFQSSYSNMSNFVDQMFPPLIEAANDYSQFIYWREPLPTIEEVLPDL